MVQPEVGAQLSLEAVGRARELLLGGGMLGVRQRPTLAWELRM